MPKKISELEKKSMVKDFINGTNFDLLIKKYNCSKITITRYLKKHISETKYKELVKKNKANESKKLESASKKIQVLDNVISEEFPNREENKKESFLNESEFVEITPLHFEIEHENQKDLSSIPIEEIKLPKVVYLLVDKNTELEVKPLKDYPDWQFLSQNELKRKTIQIFYDFKIAKKFCNKEQKIIKIPNSEIFKIAAPILLARGISRIVSTQNLIAL